MCRAAFARFAMTGLLFMTGCGGQSSLAPRPTPTPPGTTATIGLTVTDTPPTGVVVLSFQLSITGASLSPGDISLLSSTNPIPFNVSHLQADSAFLASANVAPGTYSSLGLTFANPQLTIYNSTGAAIGTCANNTICQLTPATTPLTVTFSSSPFPITLTTNSPLALSLDINLNTVIQSDLTVNLAAPNGVTLSQLPFPAAGQPTSALGQLMGTVQSVGAGEITLQTSYGASFAVYVNGSTTYDIPPTALCGGVCTLACRGLGCLVAGDVVKADVSLQSDGTLLASEVDFVESTGQQVAEGTVVAVTVWEGGTYIDLILQVAPPTSTPSLLAPGEHASVLVPASGVTYAVDWGNFAPPTNSNLGTFEGLFVGQEVLVVVQGSVSGSGGSITPPLTPVGPASVYFTTNNVLLEPTQITGQVTSIDASAVNFYATTFPSFFIPKEDETSQATPPTLSSASIIVDATAQTTYEGFIQNNFSGLAGNELVSVEGWLLPYMGPVPLYVCNGCPITTTMAAKAVRGRPNQLF